MDCQHREHRLEAAGAAQQVAGHRLGRVDHQLACVIAEGALDALHFSDVADRGRGAVRIHVLHLVRVDAGVVHCRHHAARGAAAVFERRGDVVGIRAHAEADDFRIDLGTARLGVFVLFEHHHAGTLAQHEAVAVAVPGTRGGGRIVVARGQRTCRGETAQAQRRDGRLGAAGDHHVGIAVLDQARCRADAVQAGGAGGDDGQVRAAQAELDRQVARDHVDDRGRHEERRDAARAAAVVFFLGRFDHRQTADARTHHDADTIGILLGDFERRILQRLDTCGHAEMDEGIHMAAFLAGQVVLDVEVLHFARETGRKWRCVETGDIGDARFARQGAFPRFGNAVTDRGNATQASYDDTTVA